MNLKHLGWGSTLVCDSRGKVWALGGENEGKNKLWSYDTKKDVWTNVCALPNAIQCHGACIDEKDVIYAYVRTDLLR